MKRISIIDGDLIAYRCAAAAEERSIKVKHLPTGIEKSFKTRTEFKERMQERGKEITGDYQIEDHQEPESPYFCFRVIRQVLEKIKRLTNSDELEIWCTDADNFRLELPLPSKYKGNRDDMIRPLLLKDAQEYLKRSHGAKQAQGMEVDDMIIIRAYEEQSKGNYSILPIWEKDTTQACGLVLYTEETDEFTVLPELGYLEFHKTKGVKGSGLKFLCFQWIFGDNSDHYKASDLAEERFGAKSAFDLLEPLQSPKECIELVISKFKQWYPESFEYKDWQGNTIKADWKFLLDLYFKCCYMKRSKDDPSDYNQLLRLYDVDQDAIKPYSKPEKPRKETPKRRKVQSKEEESGIQSNS